MVEKDDASKVGFRNSAQKMFTIFSIKQLCYSDSEMLIRLECAIDNVLNEKFTILFPFSLSFHFCVELHYEQQLMKKQQRAAYKQ